MCNQKSHNSHPNQRKKGLFVFISAILTLYQQMTFTSMRPQHEHLWSTLQEAWRFAFSHESRHLWIFNLSFFGNTSPSNVVETLTPCRQNLKNFFISGRRFLYFLLTYLSGNHASLHIVLQFACFIFISPEVFSENPSFRKGFIREERVRTRSKYVLFRSSMLCVLVNCTSRLIFLDAKNSTILSRRILGWYCNFQIPKNL